MIRLSILLLVSLTIIGLDAEACKCPRRSVEGEADSAYDIVVGRVISARPGKLLCSQYGPDIVFEFDVKFSYKSVLSDRIKIFGGQGGGSCGGILHENYEYLIIVHKCDDGLYTTMCSDNEFLDKASSQINFLNKHFGKNYQASNLNFLIGVVVTLFIIILIGGLGALHNYKKKLEKKN